MAAAEAARLVVPSAARDAMGLRTSAVEAAGNPPPLRLVGSLFVDSDRLIHVRSRFDGEIVAIATNDNPPAAQDPSGQHAREQSMHRTLPAGQLEAGRGDGRRALRFGDRVVRNQVLAVIWSKEVGEKKSDLIDAYSRLAASTVSLERLRTIGASAVAERTVREAERTHESDVIAVDRLERTLRSWHVGEQEIEEVRAAAKQLRETGGSRDNITEERRWAEIDVRSPIDGIIVEKNVAAGDIADPSDVLFKIADLSRLGVLAQVYEEDLPKIAALAPEDRRWLVRLKANPAAPPIEGTFELIGNIVDPRQHAAAIVGWINNADGRLLIGQFITAEIQLPAPTGEVMVPASACLERGAVTAIFVTERADSDQFERRQVALSRRAGDRVFIRSQPTASEAEAGCVPLAVGEWVVDDGAVELEGAWAEQQGPAVPATANQHAAHKHASATAPSQHH
jgi:cobalt-zinc-cadmium efflux system membrane fusion protein